MITLLLVITGGVALVWLLSHLVKSRSGYPVVEDKTLDSADGYNSLKPWMQELLGKDGTAATDLRPQGFVLVDGRRIDAQTETGEFVERGMPIEVVGTSGHFLVVKRGTLLDTPMQNPMQNPIQV